MGIRDTSIERGKHTMYIGAYDFSNGIVDGTNTATCSMNGGAMVIGEFNSLGYGGWIVDATGDYISTILPFPSQIDETEQIRFRVHYGHTSTDADTPTFKLTYSKQTDKAAGVISGPNTTTYYTTTADTTSTTANSYHTSPWKVIPKNTFQRGAPYAVSLNLASLGSASASEIYIFGLELEYTPSISKSTIDRTA